jgi:hypothetical protein
MRVTIKGLDEEFDLRDFPNVPRVGDLLNLAAMILDNPSLRFALIGKVYKINSVSWMKGDPENYVEVSVEEV